MSLSQGWEPVNSDQGFWQHNPNTVLSVPGLTRGQGWAPRSLQPGAVKGTRFDELAGAGRAIREMRPANAPPAMSSSSSTPPPLPRVTVARQVALRSPATNSWRVALAVPREERDLPTGRQPAPAAPPRDDPRPASVPPRGSPSPGRGAREGQRLPPSLAGPCRGLRQRRHPGATSAEPGRSPAEGGGSRSPRPLRPRSPGVSRGTFPASVPPGSAEAAPRKPLLPALAAPPPPERQAGKGPTALVARQPPPRPGEQEVGSARRELLGRGRPRRPCAAAAAAVPLRGP